MVIQPFDDVRPLWEAGYVAQGMRLDAIERPNPAMLFWQAAARVQVTTTAPGWAPRPSGIVVPSRTPQPVALMVVMG